MISFLIAIAGLELRGFAGGRRRDHQKEHGSVVIDGTGDDAFERHGVALYDILAVGLCDPRFDEAAGIDTADCFKPVAVLAVAEGFYLCDFHGILAVFVGKCLDE